MALAGSAGALDAYQDFAGWYHSTLRALATRPSRIDDMSSEEWDRLTDPRQSDAIGTTNPAPIRAERGERLPLPVADCQDEYPRGITHAPDSPLLKAQDDFGRRLVPRYMPPVDPTIEAEDVA